MAQPMEQQAVPTQGFSLQEQQLYQWTQSLAWVDTQIKDYEVAILARQNGSTEDVPMPQEGASQTIQNLEREVDRLKHELLLASQYTASKNRITQSLHDSHVILDTLFPTWHNENTSADEAEEQNLRDLIDERDELVVKALRSWTEVQKLTSELSALEKQVGAQHTQNRTIMSSILKLTNPSPQTTDANAADPSADKFLSQETGELRGARERLAEWKVKVDVASNVIQGLILESGLDWSKDPRLVDILLLCVIVRNNLFTPSSSKSFCHFWQRASPEFQALGQKPAHSNE
ncbi:hypothetical protein BZG36_03294 [Bifiguratus adelaidae]|uniref:Centromere protein H C-terminal domain-containing protein n=1 Tax=Bifiguratus adelaidae TaxID=1938954 RepID=A0A261XZC0_9FUNG|nr:hypothetical protein BZG36_03294 [Bifiguratus adelaidae]